MERISLTAFGRQPVTVGQLATISDIDGAGAVAPVSKWQILRDLTTARALIGLKDRDLSVLTALVSFVKGDQLSRGTGLVVFPSNRTLCERAHGMAESTLRRHIAKLVKLGLIIRHDSPNGKRYARRGAGGVIALAFGFDLQPLLMRAAEFSDRAREAVDLAERLKLQRERCLLILRDCFKLIEMVSGDVGPMETALADLQKRLRHKPTVAGLEGLERDARALLEAVHDIALKDAKTVKPSVKDSQTERHQQSPITEYKDSENHPNDPVRRHSPTRGSLPALPALLQSCPEIKLYATEPLRDWESLIRTAHFVSGMIGITKELWGSACAQLGVAETALITCYLLEKVDQIENPGAYLRALCQKGRAGGIRVEPMVMSLLNSNDRTAAGRGS